MKCRVKWKRVSAKQEKRSWNLFCFLGFVLNCVWCPYRQTMHAERVENVHSEWRFRTRIMENVPFLINCARIPSYDLWFPLMKSASVGVCQSCPLAFFSCVAGFNLRLNAAKSFNIGPRLDIINNFLGKIFLTSSVENLVQYGGA